MGNRIYAELFQFGLKNLVLQEEQQMLQFPIVRGLVCHVVLETGMSFWFKALALFRPLGLFIQMIRT